MIDYNKLQSYGHIKDVIELEPLNKKFKSFNFNVLEVNGHDILQIDKAIKIANKNSTKPTVIICHTIKGKGIKIAENNPSWHHKSLLTNKDLIDIENSLGK